MVVLCAAEVGASMAIGSLLLLADFYHRLSCVFLLIHDMKSEQLLEDYVVGGLAAKAFKGPAKDEMHNRVPANLLKELLQAM